MGFIIKMYKIINQNKEDIMERYCQSCAMPMPTDEMLGTDADGSLNTDYCKFCFSNGEFIANISMQEMIDFCVPHMVQANEGMSEQQAKEMMGQFFPTLKRWRK